MCFPFFIEYVPTNPTYPLLGTVNKMGTLFPLSLYVVAVPLFQIAFLHSGVLTMWVPACKRMLFFLFKRTIQKTHSPRTSLPRHMRPFVYEASFLVASVVCMVMHVVYSTETLYALGRLADVSPLPMDAAFSQGGWNYPVHMLTYSYCTWLHTLIDSMLRLVLGL